jgi:hypothetical protein
LTGNQLKKKGSLSMTDERRFAEFSLFCEVKGAIAAEFLKKIIYSLLTPSVGTWL